MSPFLALASSHADKIRTSLRKCTYPKIEATLKVLAGMFPEIGHLLRDLNSNVCIYLDRTKPYTNIPIIALQGMDIRKKNQNWLEAFRPDYNAVDLEMVEIARR